MKNIVQYNQNAHMTFFSHVKNIVCSEIEFHSSRILRVNFRLYSRNKYNYQGQNEKLTAFVVKGNNPALLGRD